MASTIAGVLTGVCVSHRDVDIECIERSAPDDCAAAMQSLLGHESVRECFVYATCNRAEWYVVTDGEESGEAVLTEYLPSETVDSGRLMNHDESVAHLLRVGAGLESMVIGEDQILGQLRSAIQQADHIDACGPILTNTIWKAIHVGENVRTQTGINEGITSVGRAAVVRASDVVPIKDAAPLIVGAGEMAKIAAQALVDEGTTQLTIANRTRTSAEELATELPIPTTVVPLRDLASAIAATSLVVTATGSSDPVITPDLLNQPGETLFVDIAQPRDVDPAVEDIAGITRFDIDDIEAVTRETNRDRAAAASIAEEIVAKEFVELHEYLKRKQADTVIAAMYEGAESIKERELSRAKQRLTESESSPDDVLSDFADALVGQLFAAPTKSLREAAENDEWETIQTALRIYDPAFPTGRVSFEERDGYETSVSDGESAQR